MAETVAEVGSGNEKLCAVKMLRSGATTASKAEFLREAYVHTCMLAFFCAAFFGVHMNITMHPRLSTVLDSVHVAYRLVACYTLYTIHLWLTVSFVCSAC
jgi:hypothetical protein